MASKPASATPVAQVAPVAKTGAGTAPIVSEVPPVAKPEPGIKVRRVSLIASQGSKGEASQDVAGSRSAAEVDTVSIEEVQSESYDSISDIRVCGRIVYKSATEPEDCKTPKCNVVLEDAKKHKIRVKFWDVPKNWNDCAEVFPLASVRGRVNAAYTVEFGPKEIIATSIAWNPEGVENIPYPEISTVAGFAQFPKSSGSLLVKVVDHSGEVVTKAKPRKVVLVADARGYKRRVTLWSSWTSFAFKDGHEYLLHNVEFDAGGKYNCWGSSSMIVDVDDL